MAEERFRLSPVLTHRESELEKAEGDLARITREKVKEEEIVQALLNRRREAIEAFSEGQGTDPALRTSFYEFLAHMGHLIAMQEERIRVLSESHERCRVLWQKAVMEKEKLLILKERFDGELRRQEDRRERQLLEGWIVRGSQRPSGEKEAGA
ncbi:MAG: flagellar export protein FliJ [Leptospirillia bacterium]